ncbi:MAG: hypothetical protein M0D55_02850 [Elusimicrobiota bacterium]|nr:MAG: hypothetical protein M0D55_02850 [Elusimicrobiota bacterium]
MRIFGEDEERRAFDHDRVRGWASAGLIAPEKRAEAEAAAGEPPSRAATPVRLLLFALAAAMLAALAFLMLKDAGGRAESAVYAWALAACALAGAEAGIKSLKVRRFGAEEALLCGAAVLFAYGAERLAPGESRWRFSEGVFAGALAIAAAAAYVRYGYRVATLGAAVALGFLLAAFDWGAETVRVLLAALYAALLAAVTLWPGLSRRERDRLELVRFFLALAVPLVLNLKLERLLANRYPSPVSGTFAWATFAAIFLIPAVWLAWGASARSRTLIWAGAIGLLVAQCSIKPYLGVERNSWDPAVLGTELMLAALILKRWLDSGAGGRRGGYSSEALGESAPGGALGLIAGAVASSPAGPPAGPAEGPKGGGGSFGGGGASGSF